MDDETQYRCAGYIQAEIERYADTLDLDTEGPSDDAASDAAEGAKKAKTKHVAKRSKEESMCSNSGPFTTLTCDQSI